VTPTPSPRDAGRVRPGGPSRGLRAARAGVGLAAALAASLAGPPARALPPGSTPREIELGREAARDIAKSVEFVEDDERLAKLQGMLEEIGAVTERPDVEYRPHIVASPLINAFVLPGGDVYVTTGLLDDVQSDDELAGVLAHEIAHNVNQHAIERMRNAPKGLGLLQLAAIAALIVGKSPEAAVLAQTAANTITAMVLQGSTVAAEVEADAHGIGYLRRTRYNAVGFLTFMERLASSSGKFIEEELGIYRTHPLTRDRVRSARERISELGIPVRRRLVTRAPQPQSRRLTRETADLTEIVYRGERLFLLAGHDSARAAGALATVRWVLDAEVGEGDVKVSPAEGGVLFQPDGGPPLFLSAADGAANGEGEVVLAATLRRRLAELVADEQTRWRANAQMY
jgi:predicted Zn-dependent protease